MSEDYYITNLDIWLLAKHFKLPIVFFTGTELTENNKKFLVANTGVADTSVADTGVADTSVADQKFYFIHTPGVKNDVPNSYRMVAAPKYNDKLPLSALKPEFAASIRENMNENSFLDYLDRVSELDATVKLKSKKVKVKMIEDADEVPEKAKEVPEKAKDVPEKAKEVPEKAKEVPEKAKEVPEKIIKVINKSKKKIVLNE
jgi:hypothetical protein